VTTLGIRVAFLALILLGCAYVHAQDRLSPEDAFRKGIELSEAKRFREAIPYYQIAYRAFPQSEGVLWNLGLATAEINEYSEALKYWSALRQHAPNNWRVRTKLIQAYQALGDTDARDRERTALFALRQSSPVDSDLARTESYCREQMVVAGRKILAFEVFEPKGERMVFFAFVVVSDTDTEEFRISVGSYEFTNRVEWERGALPRDKRLYHLDQYRGPNHWTYGFYESQPPYETVRAQVVDILSGRMKPISSTTVR
jgi:tetratricopeptide (TPR) repeat protein